MNGVDTLHFLWLEYDQTVQRIVYSLATRTRHVPLFSFNVVYNKRDDLVCLLLFRLWEAGWKGRYYQNKFQLSENDEGYDDFRKKVVRFYNTMIWTSFKSVRKRSVKNKILSIINCLIFCCRPMRMWKDFAGFCSIIIRCVNLFQTLRSPRADNYLTNWDSGIYQLLSCSQVCNVNTLTLANVTCSVKCSDKQLRPSVAMLREKLSFVASRPYQH